jgi:hypothetical protein
MTDPMAAWYAYHYGIGQLQAAADDAAKEGGAKVRCAPRLCAEFCQGFAVERTPSARHVVVSPWAWG